MNPNHPTARVLTDAARVIIRDGWCQGRTIDDQGRRCLSSALAAATCGNRAYSDAFRSLSVHLFGAAPTAVAGRNPTAWNDVPGRTVDEVVVALLTTADTIEGTGAYR